MATATNDVDEIRRQMALIRRDLHQDVSEVVSSAEAVADWRRLPRKYPWPALGAAVAVGYLVVPRRHKPVPVDVVSPPPTGKARARVAVNEAVEEVRAHPRKSLLAGAMGLLVPVAVRAAQSYAVHYLETWIAQLQEQQMSMAGGSSPGPQTSPAGPGRRAGA